MIKLNKKGHLILTNKKDTRALLILIGYNADRLFQSTNVENLYSKNEVRLLRQIHSFYKLLYD